MRHAGKAKAYNSLTPSADLRVPFGMHSDFFFFFFLKYNKRIFFIAADDPKTETDLISTRLFSKGSFIQGWIQTEGGNFLKAPKINTPALK